MFPSIAIVLLSSLQIGCSSASKKEVELKDYLGQRKAIVVFYRGAWCPYCTRQLSALGQIKPILDSLHVELIAISADDYTKIDSSYLRSGATNMDMARIQKRSGRDTLRCSKIHQALRMTQPLHLLTLSAATLKRVSVRPAY